MGPSLPVVNSLTDALCFNPAVLIEMLSFLPLLLFQGVHLVQGEYDYRRLVRDLTADYEPRARPVRYTNTTSHVKIFPFLEQVISLDTRDQILTTQVIILMQWIDELMQWNASDYDAILSLELPGEDVWKPEVVISNSVSDENGHYGYERSSKVTIGNTGIVTWSPLAILKTTCAVNVNLFPFDHQICEINFEIMHAFADEINITVPDIRASQYNMDINYVESSEWQLENFRCFWSTSATSYFRFHNNVTCHVGLHRRSLFYIFNLVMPCLLLLFVGMLSFFLPIESSSDRISLTVTLLLAMMVFLLVLLESMPPTSTVIPLMEEFVGGCTICLGLITAVAIAMGYVTSSELRNSRPPLWLRVIFIRKLSKHMCGGVNKRLEEKCLELQALSTPEGEYSVTSHKHVYTTHPDEDVAHEEWRVILTVADRCCLLAYIIVVISLIAHFFSHA